MENKSRGNISQIYLQPKTNPQIRVGTKFQAEIPNDIVCPRNSENPEYSHLEKFTEMFQTVQEKSISYDENSVYSNQNFIKINLQLNEKDDEKPGKKRRIEK